jgi:4-hydroxythreonine-4-phosphate dehydrogenase
VRRQTVTSAPVLLTSGDPSGVGPEIAAKAWALGERFVWIGDPRHLPEGTVWREVADLGDAMSDGPLPVLRHDFAARAEPGLPNPANARGVIDVIARAVDLVMAGKAAGICTAPINKKALKDGAGFAFPGHTEFLAHLAGVDQVVMMLACPELRVVPATIHIPLAEVPAALTEALLETTIRITHTGLIRDFGIPAPRLAVAGLNPHAGEGGAMGWEEERMIRPLVVRLAAEGMAIKGPMSADTMFHESARAGYDAAICAFHDQALIPIKTLDFAGGVNATLGLPFVRTSPDHGTAYDIAGRGSADPSSLIAALRMAHDMAAARLR